MSDVFRSLSIPQPPKHTFEYTECSALPKQLPLPLLELRKDEREEGVSYGGEEGASTGLSNPEPWLRRQPRSDGIWRLASYNMQKYSPPHHPFPSLPVSLPCCSCRMTHSITHFFSLCPPHTPTSIPPPPCHPACNKRRPLHGTHTL